jgi:hypothetical protein
MKENTINPFVDIASAASTDTSKIAQLKWNYSFDPSLPSLFVLSGSTSSASWWVYNPSICFVLDKSSTNTFSNKDNCIIKSMMNLKDYDSSLVGYWDMETTFSSGWSTYLRDLSGNKNDWNLSWWTIWFWQIAWLAWKGWIFYTWWIWLQYNPQLNSSNFTVETLFKADAGTWLIWQTILSKWDCSSWSCWQTWSYWLWLSSYSADYSSLIIIWNDDALNNYNSYAAWDLKYKAILGDKNWYHLTLRKDKNTVSIFLNWTLIFKKESTKEIANSLNPFYIWTSWHTRNAENSPWSMDDTKYYLRSLSDSEIRQHAKSIWF